MLTGDDDEKEEKRRVKKDICVAGVRCECAMEGLDLMFKYVGFLGSSVLADANADAASVFVRGRAAAVVVVVLLLVLRELLVVAEL